MRIIGIRDYMGAEEYLDDLKVLIDQDDFDLLVFMGGISPGEEHIKEYREAKEEGREPEKSKRNIVEERKRKKKDMESFFQFLGELSTTSMIVPGRTDVPLPLLENQLEKSEGIPDLHYIHCKFVQFKRMIFSGCGGVIGDEVEDFFEYRVDREYVFEMFKNLKGFTQEKILVFHTPPVDPVTDEPEEGLPFVNDIIDMLDPKFLFYGMVEPVDKMKIINDCVTINPGPLAEGNYVEVNTTTMNVEFKNLEG